MIILARTLSDLKGALVHAVGRSDGMHEELSDEQPTISEAMKCSRIAWTGLRRQDLCPDNRGFTAQGRIGKLPIHVDDYAGNGNETLMRISGGRMDFDLKYEFG